MSSEETQITQPVAAEEQATAVPRDNDALALQDTLAMQKLRAAIRTLEEVVDYETGMLEQHHNPDYTDINARKARGIRILNQTMADFVPTLDDDSRKTVERLLAGLQTRLERNRALLEIHLEAVGELAQMLQQVHEAQETDGTYNPSSLNIGRF